MRPSTTTFRAARSTYAVAAFLCTVPVAVGFMAIATRPGEPSSWGMVALASAYCTALFLWVHKFRIESGNGTITFESLLGGSRQLRVADIESVRKEGVVGKSVDRSRAPVRLVLIVRDGRGASSEVTIDLKVFRLSDVATLMEAREQ